jgi:hypothetical protein
MAHERTGVAALLCVLMLSAAGGGSVTARGRFRSGRVVSIQDPHHLLKPLQGWRIRYWTQLVEKHLPAAGSASVFGLFSYGGWADDGQYFVLVPEGGKPKLWRAAPGSDTFVLQVLSGKKLGGSDALKRIAEFRAPDLPRVAFDALERQYIAAEWRDAKLNIKHASHFRALLPNRAMDASYLELVASFKELERPSPDPAKSAD